MKKKPETFKQPIEDNVFLEDQETDLPLQPKIKKRNLLKTASNLIQLGVIGAVIINTVIQNGKLKKIREIL